MPASQPIGSNANPAGRSYYSPGWQLEKIKPDPIWISALVEAETVRLDADNLALPYTVISAYTNNATNSLILPINTPKKYYRLRKL